MEDLIKKALEELGEANEGFCSEAHFQHEFALQLTGIKEFERIILERLYPPENVQGKDIYLDMWMKSKAGKRIGIELKYKTLKKDIEILPGEIIHLKNQRASDIGRYGFWRDVERLERLVQGKKIDIGYAIFLTNDFNYWKSDGKVSKGRKTLDADFSLYSGRKVLGELKWGQIKLEAEGLKRDEKKHWTEKYPPIKLSGQYGVPNWKNFRKDGEFRYLLIESRV